MPSIDSKFKAGESVVGIESVKTAVDVYSPVAGSISETNPTVAEKAELLSESPE
jgi:glycine cleavage system H protein